MAVYPQSVKVYANITAGWTDITSDVLEKIEGFWGIRSNREVDRVADIGYMYMTMDNTAGLYAPALGTAYAGWAKGTQIKLVIRYKDRDHIRFFGTIDKLKITGGALGERRVYVTVKTWMDYAGKYPLVTTGIQSDQRADEALLTIVNAMPIKPQSHSFQTGAETFANVFDATTNTTTALVEFNKLAMSEMGYIYERMEFDTGSELTFQARTTRKGTDTPTSYTVPADDSGYVLMVDGASRILQTDNASRIKLNPTEDITATVSNNMQDIDVEYGENVRNRITVVAYPRTTDTSVKVLASLGYPLQIGAGETIEIRVPYYDPSGGAKVNAVDGTMITPVSSTDYLMNDQQDGLGTDITADLTITATYGSEGVTWTLLNVNAGTGYITLLQARGYGIYTYTSIESTVEDSTSYNAYGYASDTIHQHYQQTTELGKAVAAKILDKEREPRTILNRVFLNANKTNNLMWGFLVYDVGDLVEVVEDETGIDSQYYIHAVSFSMTPSAVGGAVIDYGWTLKENQSLASGGLTSVAVEYNQTSDAKGSYIDFGCFSEITNLSEITYMGWVYVTSSTFDNLFLFSHGNGWSGQYTKNNQLYIFNDGNNYTIFMGGGQFSSSLGGTFTLNAWHHIAVTFVAVAANTPTLYIDGASVTVSTLNASTIPDQSGWNLRIGGGNATAFAYPVGDFDGKIKDFRIYNSALSASAVLGIYNAGAYANSYTSNLIFQAFAVKTNELSYFTDHTLLSTDRLIENIYGRTGTPQWNTATTAPIVRTS